MKSPAELKQKLRRQWDNSDLRESRLLGGVDAWPVELSIGKPSPLAVKTDLDSVMRHVQQWRSVSSGEVVWDSVAYRSTAEQVEVPRSWRIKKPTDWVKVCGDSQMRDEFDTLSTMVAETDASFHSLLVRRRSLWRDKPVAEVIQAARLALMLEPGCAAGRPLRTLSLAGIDTKFFERNAGLMSRLLDVRFEDEVGRLGIEVFLGAFVEGGNWLLVVDLAGSLLPFHKQRVSSDELAAANLPGKRVLIVENESCLSQLSQLPETIAILGAGLDLGWTGNKCLRDRETGYWGDIDTWGLRFLGEVRCNLPNVVPLLMDAATFESHAISTVREPVVAGIAVPCGLTFVEQELYVRLLAEPRGRLEQEFISTKTVREALNEWAQ